MLDLETLGTAPGSVILSIGAVHFGRGEIHSEFHTHITPESCCAAGLKIDTSTAMWWMGQSEAARQSVLEGQKNAVQLWDGLMLFKNWLVECMRTQGGPIEPERVRLWGNGASFDCAQFAAAHRAVEIRRLPWKYSGERCYRTVKALHPEVPEESREGIHHNALDDAKHQARHLMKLLPTL